MTEYMTLIGVEQIQSAARQMQDAAHTIQRSMDYMVEQQRQQQDFMNDWLARFETVIREIPSPHAPEG